MRRGDKMVQVTKCVRVQQRVLGQQQLAAICVSVDQHLPFAICCCCICRDDNVVAKSPKYAKASSARGSSGNLAATGTGSGDGSAAEADSSTPKAGAGSSSSSSAAAAAGDTGGGDALSRKRAYKEKWQEAVALFNTKPKKGIALLQVGAAGRQMISWCTSRVCCGLSGTIELPTACTCVACAQVAGLNLWSFLELLACHLGCN